MSHDNNKLLRSIFYAVKPLVPRTLQIFLRRRLIAGQSKKYSAIWPILPGSEKKPPNWKGWPDGKKFALILTHDVESATGVEKCLPVTELEAKLGFRSSFNFVPERYFVPELLRRDLTQKGFEVGVHGLNHDGKLFASHKIFSERAKKINRYLREWNAVGFRAPAMHHRLEWLRELDIEYDLSTFDTDPFEPQADGVGTIFPFLLSYKNSEKTIVEMPYTLVQDFTLFVLMKKNIHIWTEKLQWLVKNGGMVLVNVHPDYMSFSDGKTRFDQYSAQFYENFLQYVSEKYSGEFWHGLPRETAIWLKGNSSKM
ncbi:MAG: hypothetical protein GXO74_06575 [Calditrichaeota bacterium]|nr:hypothetical protein [Calditrichota bacterium]